MDFRLKLAELASMTNGILSLFDLIAISAYSNGIESFFVLISVLILLNKCILIDISDKIKISLTGELFKVKL